MCTEPSFETETSANNVLNAAQCSSGFCVDQLHHSLLLHFFQDAL